MCEAISEELRSRWLQYYLKFGHRFEDLDKDGVLDHYNPVTQGYFSVYETNTSRIAQLQDSKIRDQIFRTYSKARRFIDELKLNNSLLDRFEQWKWQCSGRSSDDQPEMLKTKDKQLKEHAKLLRDSHNELNAAIDSATEELDIFQQSLQRSSRRHLWSSRIVVIISIIVVILLLYLQSTGLESGSTDNPGGGTPDSHGYGYTIDPTLLATILFLAGGAALVLSKTRLGIVGGSSILLLGGLTMGLTSLFKEVSFIKDLKVPVSVKVEGINFWKRTADDRSPAEPPQPVHHVYNARFELLLLGSVGGFETGESMLPIKTSQDQLFSINSSHPFSAFDCMAVVGGADKRPLRSVLEHEYGSNTTLAKRRADWFKNQLEAFLATDSGPEHQAQKLPQVLTLSMSPDHPERSAGNAELGLDRRVDIYGCQRIPDLSEPPPVTAKPISSGMNVQGP